MVLDQIRVAVLRRTMRLLFGLPPGAKRLLAGAPIRRAGQVLDLDLQLLGRLDGWVNALADAASMALGQVGGALGASVPHRASGTLDRATILEQRRQADRAAELVADATLDDVIARDLPVPGGAGPVSARHYTPPAAPPSGPLLIWFHGGGFVLGSVAAADPLCRLLAAQSGVRVLSVEYRLAPEHPYPAALEDALAVYAHVVASAADLGTEPGLVAVGGDSAGANLALVVAHQQGLAGIDRPVFVCALYPVTDAERSGGSRDAFGRGFGPTTELLMELERLYLPDGVPVDDLRGAPLRAEDLSVMPPVYLATAGFDPLRDEGEELAARLRAAGVPVLGRRFSSLVHGYATFTALSAAARDATLDAASALRAATTLRAPRAALSKETAYLLRSPENARRLRDAIDRLEPGAGHVHDLVDDRDAPPGR